MDALYAAFFADPMYYVGLLFALWGVWGVGLFVSGFSGGVRHLFTYGESDSHMEHVRTRIVWGLYLCMTALGAWEVVRVLVGEVSWGYLWLSLVLLVPIWIPWVKGLAGGK
jgi:hypothetical protein